MSIPGFGDTVTLIELTRRLIGFINDLRHAQDDFLGLASEAQTLRICINSVSSESCRNSLYMYINEKQGKDLRTITDTCKQNLQELNKFIASVAILVEKKGRRDRILHRSDTRGTRVGDVWRKRRHWSTGLRRAFAKCWAAYKFTMADKQAYRDKLILPTQAVNVFLTSMTHVGLANMSRIMGVSAGLPVPKHPLALLPGPANPQPASGKPKQYSDGTWDQGQLVDWDVVGRHIAIRKPSFFIRRQTLTPEFEAEVLLYMKHLIKGGDSFSYVFEKQKQHFRISKSPLEKKPKKPVHVASRSRSRSRPRTKDRMALGRDGAGMFVQRRKSINVSGRDLPSSEDERQSKPQLALPAPDYIEIEPEVWESDSDKSLSPSEGGGRSSFHGRDTRVVSPRRRRRSSSNAPAARRETSNYDPTSASQSKRQRQTSRSRSSDASPGTWSNMRHESHEPMPWQDLPIDTEAIDREIDKQIQEEQDQAMREVETAEEPERTRRRTLMSRDSTRTEAEKEDMDEYYDLADNMRYLDETYGLLVTPAPPNRPPVDNGEVHGDSEEVTYDPQLARADRLKAETSAPESYMQAMKGEDHQERPHKPDPSERAEIRMQARTRTRLHSYSRVDPSHERYHDSIIGQSPYPTYRPRSPPARTRPRSRSYGQQGHYDSRYGHQRYWDDGDSDEQSFVSKRERDRGDRRRSRSKSPAGERLVYLNIPRQEPHKSQAPTERKSSFRRASSIHLHDPSATAAYESYPAEEVSQSHRNRTGSIVIRPNATDEQAAAALRERERELRFREREVGRREALERQEGAAREEIIEVKDLHDRRKGQGPNRDLSNHRQARLRVDVEEDAPEHYYMSGAKADDDDNNSSDGEPELPRRGAR